MGSNPETGYFPGNYVEIKKSTPMPPRKAVPAPPPRATAKEPAAGLTRSSFDGEDAGAKRALTTKMPAKTLKARPKPKSVQGKAAAQAEVNQHSGSGRFSIIMNASVGVYGGSGPVWQLPLYADLFADPYKRQLFDIDSYAQNTPAIKRLGMAVDIAYQALQRVSVKEQLYEELGQSVTSMMNMLRDSSEMCLQVPIHKEDSVSFYTFLVAFMTRIRSTRPGDSLMVPFSWSNDEGHEHAVVLLLTKSQVDYDNGETGSTFCITLVNTGCGEDLAFSGLHYHPASIDPALGHVKRVMAIEFNDINEDKVTNAAYWVLIFRSVVFPAGPIDPQSSHAVIKVDSKHVYERLLPWLTDRSFSLATDLSDGYAVQDFVDVPMGGDSSFIHLVLECFRYVGRKAGLDQVQAMHLPMLFKNSLLRMTMNDLRVAKTVTIQEMDVIKMAVDNCCLCTGMQGLGDEATATVSSRQLQDTLQTAGGVRDILKQLDENSTASCPAVVEGPEEELPASIGDWAWFGRLRRDNSVESLAGVAPVPPIMRPIEMTLVPDRVNSFHEVALSMRHCLNLCTLLHNQRQYVRNSYTLRLCLIEHLFVRVIPLPLHIGHEDRNKRCFWHSQDIRYETQADILRHDFSLLIGFLEGHGV
jgi:hypothetical protein